MTAPSARPGGRSALVELTRARVFEFLREPGAIFWVFGFPVVMALILGLAFRSREPQRLPVGVVDGADAGWVVDALAASDDLAPRRLAAGAAADALRLGRVELVVETTAEGDGARGPLRYRFDPTRPESRLARLRVDDLLQRARGRADVAAVADERITEQGSRYVDFLMPGLIGLNVMSSSMWGIGFAVVTLRTRKLLKRFAASPMRRSDFLLSLMLSRLVFLVLEVVVLVAFGWLLFDVAVRGSLFTLAAVAVVGSLSFTGLSVLVAARAQSIETASGLMNLMTIPMWLCSGSFFSYARFPEALQPAIRALPLTALNDALRAVMNEGAGLVALPVELGVLAFWGVLSFGIALRIFRWR